MKIIDIVGENYFGKWDKTRTACRAVVLKDNKLLLSYETNTDQWMLPGGGLEEDETEEQCVIREVAEETGSVIKPSGCMLEIDEYYENWKWVNRYFFGEMVGATEVRLTEREKEVGMKPRWLPVDEVFDIFSKHQMFKDTDEMRRGMYLREYTALKELLPDLITQMITVTKEMIIERLNNQNACPDYVLKKQLVFILEELDKMVKIKNSAEFYPYYPRGIADSWDYNDELGDRLLEVLSIYTKL